MSNKARSTARACRARDKKYLAAKDKDKPPYVAETCAWQTRKGTDGRLYRSEPNDQGQFVWKPVPLTRLQRVRSGTRKLWSEHGPAAMEYAAYRAARLMHQRMLPDINYFNHQAAWDHSLPTQALPIRSFNQ